ncbi:hypothetical protein EXU57_14930 [Segetibacter sp. 3557_3]|uniref:hypothetical protein n=1 Tax=Segetibacter sp. 3557_3 TaxID=2547429 RepID=UPI001058F36E|nr:hypothetical protein [Segetibacter sp. 3557_3]TDH24628.1 hypothetical protein EXU57_14930 [Segetibacter sp. 3557_3]
MKALFFELYNQYIGSSIELNGLQITVRISVILLALLLFIRFSGINAFNLEKQNAFNTSITAIVVFYAAFSVFSVDGFVSCLVSIFIFGVLLRAIGLIAHSGEPAFKDKQVSN